MVPVKAAVINRFGEFADIKQFFEVIRSDERRIHICSSTMSALIIPKFDRAPQLKNREQSMVTHARLIWTNTQAFAKKLSTYMKEVACHYRFSDSEQKEMQKVVSSVNASTQELYRVCKQFLQAYDRDQSKSYSAIEPPNMSTRGFGALVSGKGGLAYKRKNGNVSEAKYASTTYTEWAQGHINVIGQKVLTLSDEVQTAEDLIRDAAENKLQPESFDAMFKWTMKTEREVKQMQQALCFDQDAHATDKRMHRLEKDREDDQRRMQEEEKSRLQEEDNRRRAALEKEVNRSGAADDSAESNSEASRQLAAQKIPPADLVGLQVSIFEGMSGASASGTVLSFQKGKFLGIGASKHTIKWDNGKTQAVVLNRHNNGGLNFEVLQGHSMS
jgi:hypothetical protein